MLEVVWRIVLLINDAMYNITKITHFRVANTRGLNLHIKNSTKCETVARIHDAQVAKVWNNVANCDR